VLKNLIHLEQRSSMGPSREKDRRRGHLLDNTKLLKVAKTFFTIWSLPSFQADQSFQRACKHSAILADLDSGIGPFTINSQAGQLVN
jgi:hypothetical protein